MAGRPSPAKERSTSDQLKLIGGVLVGAALVLFFVQNGQDVRIHFLWFSWTTRMVWALIASAVFGALAAFAFSTLRRRKTVPPAPQR